MNVPIDHIHKITAPLTRKNGCHVNSRENALGAKGFRQHRAGMYAVPDIVHMALKKRILDLCLEEIERPKDREARFDESRKLLVEEDEILLLDAHSLLSLEVQCPSLLPDRYRQESLFLQMVTHFFQRLAHQCGRYDFTTWLGIFAVEFHRLIAISERHSHPAAP